MKNYFYHLDDVSYPKDLYYRPHICYPEYPFETGGFSEQPNHVYGMVREMLCKLGLDKENYGTKAWNPLGEYIKPGQTVLIKPNLVKDHNELFEGIEGLECLVTHPAVLKCVLDYVWIALSGTGEIIIADAPVQGCDFDKLIANSGYSKLVEFYRDAGITFQIEDLRSVRMVHKDGVNISKENISKYKGIEVNLGSESYFYNNPFEGKVRITNYDYRQLNQNHCGDIQKYCISEACLKADVIVNLCKPKAHRKAGYTGAMKNLIGINTSKEYLPHHTKGSKAAGKGDEFYSNQLVSWIRSTIREYMDICNKKGKYKTTKGLRFVLKVVERLGRKIDTEKYREGSWWGNDTIWKTILDINKIVLFADKHGIIQSEQQRNIIHIGDMIVCGEKEGPLLPTPKKVNGILFAENAVCFDLILTRLMGFKQEKLPVIINAMGDKVLFSGDVEEIAVNSNQERYNKKLQQIKDDFAFHASQGWTGVIDKY